MPPLELVLAFHNHQPVGNFGHVFQEAHDRCYRPLLDALAAEPTVKVALHHTGPLLEWLLERQPDYLKDVRALVLRGQVELLGGGFYEPMLAVLPDRDARGQIDRMQRFCEARLGGRPAGMWLAERVWDPDLPRVIAPTGTRFTLLDDSHFFAAGLPEQRLYGHYVTEKAGAPLAIFPIDKGLRYALPFKPVPELSADLERMAREVPTGLPSPLLTYGDDGEKFGLWPGTHAWVYGADGKGGWLRDFLRLLTDRQDIVRTVHPTEAMAAPSSGRIYLPTASYEEMGEWAMPPDSIRRYEELKHKLTADGSYDRYHAFVRGGIWQSFFSKYPESNRLHKRMLDVSAQLAVAEEAGRDVSEAKTELYRSQCNCAYWHGLFGGLYLNSLRHALTHSMIRAQALLDAGAHGDEPFLSVERRDYDADLEDELLVRSRELHAAIDPAEGGSLVELSHVPAAYDVSDVLSRRDEGYHDKLRELDRQQGETPAGANGGPASIHELAQSKEKNLSRYLVVDGYRRGSFLDRFYAKDFKLPELRAGGDGDVGDFARRRYRIDALEGAGTGQASLRLSADGTVWHGGRHVPVRLEKRYGFSKDEARLTVAYRLQNRGDGPLELLFAPELNLTLLAGDNAERFYELPDGGRARMSFRGELGPSERLRLCECWGRFKIELSALAPFSLWAYPVETVSQSEGGFERTYQGSCLLLRTPLSLAPGGEAKLEFGLGFLPFDARPDERA
ncbi:MAG: alpha-amylase/4-alpha-glucanotransferase domain-containing protein [Deltaproteobacteria bacterium]